ncbi:MAG TPA: alpha/beta fold hydrolase [Burkholderiaceae bacterium]
MRGLIVIAALIVVLYALVCLGLYVFQRSLIYFPQPGSGPVPGTTTLTLTLEGQRVLVTVRPHAGAAAVLYFGGNAEDVSASLPELMAAFPDHAIYLLHYRGYGGSSGSPSEKALVADALALAEQVQAQHPELTVIGRSLGSGVAVRVAAARPVARLVLVTPYDSVQGLAVQQFPYVPVRWLLIDTFESSRHAPQVTAPTLLLVAEHDEVIPRASTEALYARFRPGVATLHVIPQTGHNTISASPDYIGLLAAGR